MDKIGLALKSLPGEKYFTQDAYGTLQFWKNYPHFNCGHGWFMSSDGQFGRCIEKHPARKELRDDSLVYLARVEDPEVNLFEPWMNTKTISIQAKASRYFRQHVYKLSDGEASLILSQFLKDYDKGLYLEPERLPREVTVNVSINSGLIPKLNEVAKALGMSRADLVVGVLSTHL